MPLGVAKLRAIELLQAIISLKHLSIMKEVRESEVMQVVLSLVEKHPWNNMVQLKANQIFEDVLSA